MTHPDLIAGATVHFPHRPCVVEPNRTFTFAEVDDRADRLVGVLFAAGVEPGDRVALLAGNGVEHLELQIASQRAGFVFVPVNWRLGPADLAQVIADCAPSLLVYDALFADAARDQQVPRRWQLRADSNGGDPSYDGQIAAATPAIRGSIDHDAIAMLLYTSGTTGRAKGVAVTNRAHLARITSLLLELHARADDRFLQVLPMFHLAGTFSHAFAFVGATNVVLPAFDVDAALDSIEKHRVTHTLLVPTAIDALLTNSLFGSTDLSSLRAILYGGSSISSDGLRRAMSAFGDVEFFQMYGMTEAGPATLLRPDDHSPDRPEELSSAGRDIAMMEVAVMNFDGSRCPDGEVGEIVVRGPAVMSGYWNSANGSDDALRDGWLHTGDVGRRRSDGLLFVTDRMKDIIISGGENISALEVERVIATDPNIAECAVVGVPDERYGQRVHAVVATHPGLLVNSTELDLHVRSQLAGYKRPRTYEFVAALPRNAMGKVAKHLIRAQYAAQQADRDPVKSP